MRTYSWKMAKKSSIAGDFMFERSVAQKFWLKAREWEWEEYENDCLSIFESFVELERHLGNEEDVLNQLKES